MTDVQDPDAQLAPHLQPDETIAVRVAADDAIVGVSQRRLLVVDGSRVRLDIPIERLRRIQLDVERDRPASFVIVPELARDEPQVLAISPTEYEAAARALILLGLGLARSNAVD
jgi:hypothetical protein